ncbi:hypothetical protein EMCRGX_G033315 [Ephydatia muelleri]
MAYSVEERGSPYTADYRVFVKKDNEYISPFHDIPLYATEDKSVLNMVVEIPRWTNAKMEICTSEPLNPIKQDVKKDKLRFVDNCFPYHGYIWNYGAFPQTWEDPSHVDPNTHAKGDNDPLDVCEIGSAVAKRGEIKRVKVLGTIALIDEGETDWKILAIDVNDARAKDLNDIEDVQRVMPGFLEATVNWFRVYKIPTGKPPNAFAFDGKAQDKSYAVKVVEEMHHQWTSLIDGKSKPGSIVSQSTTLSDKAGFIAQSAAQEIVGKKKPSGPAAAIPSEVDTWHFIKL